jgi:hypothetical protein
LLIASDIVSVQGIENSEQGNFRKSLLVSKDVRGNLHTINADRHRGLGEYPG